MRVWILGAPDPEMQMIERLLAEVGEQAVHALDATGQRVHPGSAYRTAALSAPVPEGAACYAVECGGPAVPAGATVIDHHRPGDPGYGRPPADYLPASSLGQVIDALERLKALPRAWLYDGPNPRRQGHYMMPAEYAYCAAADHCLAAAYRGECPPVDPEALMHWRCEQRAAQQGRSVAEVEADVERARERVRTAPRVHIWLPAPEGLGDDVWAGEPTVADLRGEHVPELPEAAVREGMVYLATVADRDGRQKIVLGGHADAETVRAFLGSWAPREGLVDVYGDPARGFAGGYVAGAEATERMDG